MGHSRHAASTDSMKIIDECRNITRQSQANQMNNYSVDHVKVKKQKEHLKEVLSI
jgi:hypothetical protein